MVNLKCVIFYHDNAHPQAAKLTQEKIRLLGMKGKTPYSLDSVPSDFHLFQLLKHFISGKTFRSGEEVKNGLTHFLQKIKKNTNVASKYCFIVGLYLLKMMIIIFLIKTI